MGTLTESDKEYLAQNFVAFFRRDYKRVAELHIESGWVPPETRVNDLESAIRAVCEPYFDRPLKEISLGMVLMRLFQTSRRFNVEIQPQLVLLQKPCSTSKAWAAELEMNLICGARPSPSSKMDAGADGPAALWRELRAEAPHYAKLLPELPRLLYDALRQRPADQQHRSGTCWKPRSAPIGCCSPSSMAVLGLCWACWPCSYSYGSGFSEARNLPS